MDYKKVTKIKNILLITPFSYTIKNRQIGVDPVVSRHAGQNIKAGSFFPIGLAYLGAMLKQVNYKFKILDPMVEKVPLKKIYRYSKWADAIVMPFSPHHKNYIIRYLKDFQHKLRIVSGSVAPNIHEYLFKNNFADVIFIGEPEKTMVDIVKKYPNLSKVRGIMYRKKNGSTATTKERSFLKNLDKLPFPVRDFNDPKNYWDIGFYGQPTAFILPTRGCPFRCIFCSQYRINKQRYRKRSPKNVVDEMEEIVKKQKVTHFTFFDETFNIDPKYVKNICNEILRRKLKIKWLCAARADLLTEDVLKKMKESGCVEMRFGLESANNNILKYLQKDNTVEQIRRGIEMTRKAGINFSLQCIIGSPMESEKTIRNTLEFIKEAKPLFVSFNVLTPLPGSRLFEQVKDKLDLVDGVDNFDILHTDFPLGKYSAEELAGIVRKLYLSYYLSLGFLARISKEILKHPRLGVWIIKTLLTQSGFILKSVVLRR